MPAKINLVSVVFPTCNNNPKHTNKVFVITFVLPFHRVAYVCDKIALGNIPTLPELSFLRIGYLVKLFSPLKETRIKLKTPFSTFKQQEQLSINIKYY